MATTAAMDETDNILNLYGLLRAEVESFEAARSERVLDDIDGNFQRFARMVTLFLVSERDTYYGYVFMAMTFRTDFCSKSIAGIRLDEYPPVFETNPLILMKYSLREIMYIFCHEVDHVVFNHPAEMVRANPKGDPEVYRLFNLAADAAVNDQLNSEIANGKKFLKAPRGIITSRWIQKTFGLANVLAGESYRYYFDLIRPTEDDEGEDQWGLVPGGQGEDDNEKEPANGIAPIPGVSQKGQRGVPTGTPEGSDADDGDDASADTDAGAGAQRAITADQAAGSITDHAWAPSGDDAMDDVGEMLAEATKELVNEANEIMGSEARGMMPASFASQVEKLNQLPKLNWQSILKKYVGTVSANKQKTRARLNRRQPRRFDLSGERESKTLKIVVAIDTSGSMGDEEIQQIFNEIFGIIAHRKFELTVIECDAEIQGVYTVKRPDDLPKRVYGRGGTAFTPVIKYINENRQFRDALLIYFTDGFGEQRIPKPLTYRNLWVILGATECLSVRKPYGMVLPLREY